MAEAEDAGEEELGSLPEADEIIATGRRVIFALLHLLHEAGTDGDIHPTGKGYERTVSYVRPRTGLPTSVRAIS